MNYFKQYRDIENLESDITYEAYVKLTLSTVPEIIETALDNQIKRLKIHLEFKNHQTGFTGVVGDVMLGDVRIAKGVNIIEFKEYIEKIPNARVITFKRLEHLDIYIDTLDLINFYYEELQKEEYKINTGNKLEEKQNEPIEYSDTISRITDFAIDNCLASTLTIHLDFINKPTKEHNLNDVIAVISVGDMVMGEVNVGYFIATINDIPSIHILTYDNDELIFTVDIADLLDYEHEKLLESEQARLQLR